MKKLDQQGFTHAVLAMMFMVVFAIVGVTLIVASHAQTPTAKASKSKTSKVKLKPATIKISAEYQKTSPQGDNSYGKSKAVVYVQLQDATGSCNGVPIHFGTVNMGRVRTLRCTPAPPVSSGYTIYLDGHQQVIVYHNNGSTTLYEEYSSPRTISGGNYSIKLGTSKPN